jgi:hypothetical protein
MKDRRDGDMADFGGKGGRAHVRVADVLLIKKGPDMAVHEHFRRSSDGVELIGVYFFESPEMGSCPWRCEKG